MESRRLRNGLLGLAFVALIGFAGVLAWQAWNRPAVVQYDNLKYIQLLRTACSSQREDYLEGVRRAVSERRQSGQMSDAEWEEFEKIFAIARQGDWHSADRQAYRLEQGQLNRRRP
ncbi:MAG: hypothetical protein FJ308_18145 [Planctomycetes bacterium]|nr:hypothetical protein [Planctomycetota bacterium]